MTQALLVLAVALTVGAVVFGITVLLTSDRHGLRPTEPDSRALPLPADRPLVEPDLPRVRFDTAARGYRMAQVDAAMRRVAYDIGYKDELIKVLQAEVVALREGRFPDAEVLRRAKEAAAAAPPQPPEATPDACDDGGTGDGEPADVVDADTSGAVDPTPDPDAGEAVPGDAVPGDAVPGEAVPGDAVPGDATTTGRR